MNTKLMLKLLAPYFAVGIFWCLFSDAWLAILAYHLQIIFWSRSKLSENWKQPRGRLFFLALPSAAAGPLLYFLLPHITVVDLSVWLGEFHLSRLSLMLMIPYFGLVHPCLEQMHWAGLRDKTVCAHFLFAGYHMLVLYSLLSLPWLLLCFAVLVLASYIWQQMARQTGSLALPILSHILADLSAVVAVWFL